MTEREEFENYIEANYGSDAIYKTEDGEYYSHVTNIMWLAWQHQQQRLALKDLEIMRLREVLKDADELIAIEPFEHVAQEAADAHYAIRQALSTPATYDDLMAWHEAQLGEVVGWQALCKSRHFGFGVTEINLDGYHPDFWQRPLYAKKG